MMRRWTTTAPSLRLAVQVSVRGSCCMNVNIDMFVYADGDVIRRGSVCSKHNALDCVLQKGAVSWS
jgi:hypothetical protein